MDTIGDYYDRKRKEQEAAGDRYQQARLIHEAHPCYENHEAMLKAEQEWIDAGNTGD